MRFNEKQIASLFGIAAMRGANKVIELAEEENLTQDQKNELISCFTTAFMGLSMEMAELVNNPRGFEVAHGFEDKGVTLPHRGTSDAAGYDFHTLDDAIVMPHETVVLDTGVKAYMPYGEVLKIYPRSSMGIKKNLVLANGVAIIDSDYYNNPNNDGHIMIAIRNAGDVEQYIKAGDRIAQGIFCQFLDCDDEPEETREGGIGSTGK